MKGIFVVVHNYVQDYQPNKHEYLANVLGTFFMQKNVEEFKTKKADDNSMVIHTKEKMQFKITRNTGSRYTTCVNQSITVESS